MAGALAHRRLPRGRSNRSNNVRSGRGPAPRRRPRGGGASTRVLPARIPTAQRRPAQWAWFTLRIEDRTVTAGSVRLPRAGMKNKKALPLPLTGQLLPLVARRWALRVPECPFVFHRDGHAIRDFRATWAAACDAVGLPGLLFHDLRRSGARNYRRAGVTEEVIMRIGGGEKPRQFSRYHRLDEPHLPPP